MSIAEIEDRWRDCSFERYGDGIVVWERNSDVGSLYRPGCIGWGAVSARMAEANEAKTDA